MIKPPIKTTQNKQSICSWIIEKFPENYQDMNYIEPFINNGSVFLNKLKSKEEIAGDLSKDVITIWRVLRDENRTFRNKLTKLKYNEKSFEFVKNKKVENDYFKESIKNFILIKMSKSGNKEIFEPIERKKANRFWKETIENLSLVENRISDAYFLDKSPVEIIKYFDDQNTFCFCCPPAMVDDKKSKLSIDDYSNIVDAVLAYRGKAMFCGNNCTFYRRTFKDWKLIKKKSSSKKGDCLWINF